MLERLRLQLLVLLLATGSLLVPASAFAYIGPGTGLSAIGSLLALLATVLVVIFGFVWYPLKRLMRKRTKVSEDQTADESGERKE
ncbi:MAG: hypothetical protein ACREO2_08780 [Arenimonas sp.]